MFQKQAQAPVQAALLAVRGLCKSFFGVQVLHDVGFELAPGRVLGLIGENGSGKSTTMNILGGIHQPDRGEMVLDGQPYRPRGPKDAEAAGIAFIHQELNLFKNLSIEENLFIGGFPKLVRGLPFIDRRKVRARAKELLAAIDLDLDPATLVSRLSQGERQLVEIAKALGSDARIVIFDEPTTSLTARETERLFGQIQRLKGRGIAVVYISHILSDVMRLTDDIVVLRDGHVVATAPTRQMTVDKLITSMVGRTIDQIYPPRASRPREGQPVLEVEKLTQPGMIRDVSFQVRQGEVVGISGLMGSGRSEMARILFGLDPYASGRILVDGQPLERPTPEAAMARGIAFLTEDRRAEGLMMDGPIADNLALPSLPNFAGGFGRLIERTRLGDAVERTGRDVQVNARDFVQTLVKNLSGGNQQKVVIGKWLLRSPRLFILDEPTRGIDVGAKYEVYKIINELAGQGTGVLVISSEIEELIGICDRILVMSHGEIRAGYERAKFDRERIMRSAMWDSVTKGGR
jgi:ABC-type sugar transport system ATPase subunit